MIHVVKNAKKVTITLYAHFKIKKPYIWCRQFVFSYNTHVIYLNLLILYFTTFCLYVLGFWKIIQVSLQSLNRNLQIKLEIE